MGGTTKVSGQWNQQGILNGVLGIFLVDSILKQVIIGAFTFLIVLPIIERVSSIVARSFSGSIVEPELIDSKTIRKIYVGPRVSTKETIEKIEEYVKRYPNQLSIDSLAIVSEFRERVSSRKEDNIEDLRQAVASYLVSDEGTSSDKESLEMDMKRWQERLSGARCSASEEWMKRMMTEKHAREAEEVPQEYEAVESIQAKMRVADQASRQDTVSSEETKSLAREMYEKRQANAYFSIAFLGLFLAFYIMASSATAASSDWRIPCLAIVVTGSILVRQAMWVYRIRKGYFGNSEHEIRELIAYILTEAERRDPSNGKRAIVDQFDFADNPLVTMVRLQQAIQRMGGE